MSHTPDRNPIPEPTSAGEVVRRAGTDFQDKGNNHLATIGLALDLARSYIPRELLPVMDDADKAIEALTGHINGLTNVPDEVKWRNTIMGPALDLKASIKPAETKPDTTA